MAKSEDDSKQQNTAQSKARYWAGVLYPENMKPGWEDDIDDIIQLPFSWVRHNQDKDRKGQPRKEHIDLIIAFPNTTTYNNALTVFNSLSQPGKQAINKCERIVNIRNRYDYQIHDTPSCKKHRAQKHLYDESERHTGNGFDIGNYEQISQEEKEAMAEELADLIYQQNMVNFADLRQYVRMNMENKYLEIVRNYSGYLEKLTRGNYQKLTPKEH